MKMILAYVPPHRLDRVTRALEHVVGFPGMTVTESGGFGREKVEAEAEDRRASLKDYTDTARIEVVAHDRQVEGILAAIHDAAHTGRRGDGKIFILPVEGALRIKTGERGETAV